MHRLFWLLAAAIGCLPEMPVTPTLDVGAPAVTPDAGRTTAPPPPPPITDTGPRDVGFGELSIIGLTPNQGPSTGGTRVQLRGEGFLPETVVEPSSLIPVIVSVVTKVPETPVTISFDLIDKVGGDGDC